MQNGSIENEETLSRLYNYEGGVIKSNDTISTKHEENQESNESYSSSTDDYSTVKEKDYDESKSYDRTGKTEQTEVDTEESFGRSVDRSQTKVFGGSLGNIMRDDDVNDEYESYDIEKESADVAELYSDISPEDPLGDSDIGEILVHTPTKHTLSQDAVLDFKARTGRAEEDNGNEKQSDDDEHDQNESDGSRIGHFPRHNTDDTLRTGYVSPDDYDDVLKPPDQNIQNSQMPIQHYGNTFNQPGPAYNIEQRPSFQWKNNIRSDTAYPNSQPRLSPLLYESIKSRELLFPKYDSREQWGQNPSSGVLTKPYFSLTYPNKQLDNAGSGEICSSCFPPKVPQDRTFRRSDEANANLLKTTNGRSIDYDTSAANEYPLVTDSKVDENLVSRLHSPWSNDVLDSGRNRVQETKYVEDKVQSETGPLSNFFMNLPINFPRNNPRFLRVGLGGVPRFAL